MDYQMTDVNIEAGGVRSVDEIARIRSRIQDYFTDSLANGEGRYYLARLGSLLGSDRTALEALTGKKLVAFVQDDLGHEIEREGAHNNIIVVKIGEPIAGVRSATTATPRYAPRFWAAFRVPLGDEGDHRFINLSTMAFGTSREEVGDGEIREIGSEFIVQNGGPVDASVILENIDKWLAEEGLEAKPFLLQRKEGQQEDKSLLDLMILALNGEQLKRVSLPLDVVKTLKDQSV